MLSLHGMCMMQPHEPPGLAKADPRTAVSGQAARARRVGTDVCNRRSTLYKPIKAAIIKLDVAKEHEPTNFAMLWLRDGTQRKTLKQMKERGQLAEWLRGALVPSIRRLLRESNGDLWFSITAFASPSSCICRLGAGMQVSSTWARRRRPWGLLSATVSGTWRTPPW